MACARVRRPCAGAVAACHFLQWACLRLPRHRTARPARPGMAGERGRGVYGQEAEQPRGGSAPEQNRSSRKATLVVSFSCRLYSYSTPLQGWGKAAKVGSSSCSAHGSTPRTSRHALTSSINAPLKLSRPALASQRGVSSAVAGARVPSCGTSGVVNKGAEAIARRPPSHGCQRHPQGAEDSIRCRCAL